MSAVSFGELRKGSYCERPGSGEHSSNYGLKRICRSCFPAHSAGDTIHRRAVGHFGWVSATNRPPAQCARWPDRSHGPGAWPHARHAQREGFRRPRRNAPQPMAGPITPPRSPSGYKVGAVFELEVHMTIQITEPETEALIHRHLQERPVPQRRRTFHHGARNRLAIRPQSVHEPSGVWKDFNCKRARRESGHSPAQRSGRQLEHDAITRCSAHRSRAVEHAVLEHQPSIGIGAIALMSREAMQHDLRPGASRHRRRL